MLTIGTKIAQCRIFTYNICTLALKVLKKKRSSYGTCSHEAVRIKCWVGHLAAPLW